MKKKKVSGGFYGKDWSSKKYTPVYKQLGIEHKKHNLKRDEYFLEGEKIPKKFVYAAVDSYLAEKPTAAQEDILCDILNLRTKLSLGIKDAKDDLEFIWKTFD